MTADSLISHRCTTPHHTTPHHSRYTTTVTPHTAVTPHYGGGLNKVLSRISSIFPSSFLHDKHGVSIAHIKPLNIMLGCEFHQCSIHHILLLEVTIMAKNESIFFGDVPSCFDVCKCTWYKEQSVQVIVRVMATMTGAVISHQSSVFC